MNYLAISLKAGHDINGNPRRVWVVLDGGEVVDAIDEGYLGAAAVLGKYPNAILGPRFETTLKEYKSLLRLYKDVKAATYPDKK